MGHSQLRRMPSYLLTLLRTFLLISCEDGSNRWLDGHIRYEVRQGVNRRLGGKEVCGQLKKVLLTSWPSCVRSS